MTAKIFRLDKSGNYNERFYTEMDGVTKAFVEEPGKLTVVGYWGHHEFDLDKYYVQIECYNG